VHAGNQQRPVKSPPQRLPLSRAQEGPNQHRVQDQDGAVHWRAGQVQYVLASGRLELREDLASRLQAPQHRDGL